MASTLEPGYDRLVDGVSQDHAILADRDGVIRGWPPELEGLLGYGVEEAVGRRVDLIVPPALRSRHWRGFSNAVESGRLKREGKPFTTVALHRSGKLVAMRALLELNYGDDGAVSGVEARILGAGPSWLAPLARVALAPLGLIERLRRVA